MLLRPPSWVGIAVVLWLAALALGYGLLTRYKVTPGAETEVPRDWPEGACVRPRDGNAHLIMFIHPKCPCTRAAVAELARVMARCQGRLGADVLFLRAEDESHRWEADGLFETASRIPGVHASWDVGGREARRFGARTSSHVVVYDGGGRLRFSGGLTPARGHEGGNAGSDAVIAIAHGRSAPDHSPVYGCSLETPEGSRPKESR